MFFETLSLCYKTCIILSLKNVKTSFCLDELQYKLKRCSNKECFKQCRYVMFKGTMTKWPVQKLTQGTTQELIQHHDATDI